MKIETTRWVGNGGGAIWPIIKILCNSTMVKDAHLIDMGCGCGILGLQAIKEGYATSVVLCDIDQEAVEVTNSNILVNGYQNSCTAIQADTWDCVETGKKIYDVKKFNLMIGSLPLTWTTDYVPPNDINPFRQIDINYEFHMRLASDISDAMEPESFLIMCDFWKPPSRWLELMNEKCHLTTTIIPSCRSLWKNTSNDVILKYVGKPIDGIDMHNDVDNLEGNHIVVRLWQVR